MLNSSDAALIGGTQNPAIPERRFNKYEGWYTMTVESVEENENVDEPDHAFTEYNMKCRILNGPSKGVEFIRLSTPPVDHPDFVAKVYGPDGQAVKDADGNPVLQMDEETGLPVPNGRMKRQVGLTRDVLNALFVGDKIKGKGDEAKQKRTDMITAAVVAAGSMVDALTGGKFIAKMRMDRGVRTDQDTGKEIVYSPALKKEPRLKAASFMSFDEKREAKYVLDPKNLAPPKDKAKVAAAANAPKVDLAV